MMDIEQAMAEVYNAVVTELECHHADGHMSARALHLAVDAFTIEWTKAERELREALVADIMGTALTNASSRAVGVAIALCYNTTCGAVRYGATVDEPTLTVTEAMEEILENDRASDLWDLSDGLYDEDGNNLAYAPLRASDGTLDDALQRMGQVAVSAGVNSAMVMVGDAVDRMVLDVVWRATRSRA